jgi:hypothetical protein
LKQGPSQGIAEYNVEFQLAFTDLAGHVTDEQIKIEKYRNGLQHDLREMCRTSSAGTRWARVTDIIQYATLQWPAVQGRIAKRKKSSGEVTKVAGKRKSSGGRSGKTSKARLSASAGLSDEQHKKDMAEKLCHICHQPGHQARQCPPNCKNKKGGKVAAVGGNTPSKDESDENLEADITVLVPSNTVTSCQNALLKRVSRSVINSQLSP